MPRSDPAKRAAELREVLSRALVAYHVDDDPIMEDAAYDVLYDELAAIETEHPEVVKPDSPTQRVGAPISGSFQKVRHLAPMGSLEKVNTDDHHGLQFDYSLDANGHPDNIYCRSDHYEYARYGIPIAFFTTGIHSDYHQVTDEPEYIDYDHMARIDRFIADVATHVANMDHRVVVDHPKPDPHAACQQ